MKMNAEYDVQADALYIPIRQAEIRESDELLNGVVVDIGYDDQIVGIEILQASVIASDLVAQAKTAEHEAA